MPSRFTVPNAPDVTDLAQAEVDKGDWDAVRKGIKGTGVLSGMDVTPQSALTIAVAAGTYQINGAAQAYAGGTVALAAANGTNPRFDVIYAEVAGVAVATGTVQAAPFFPTIPEDAAALAVVEVRAGVGVILSGDIVGKSIEVTQSAASGSGLLTAATRKVYLPDNVPGGLLLNGSTGQWSKLIDYMNANGPAHFYLPPGQLNMDVPKVHTMWGNTLESTHPHPPPPAESGNTGLTNADVQPTMLMNTVTGGFPLSLSCPVNRKWQALHLKGIGLACPTGAFSGPRAHIRFISGHGTRLTDVGLWTLQTTTTGLVRGATQLGSVAILYDPDVSNAIQYTRVVGGAAFGNHRVVANLSATLLCQDLRFQNFDMYNDDPADGPLTDGVLVDTTMINEVHIGGEGAAMQFAAILAYINSQVVSIDGITMEQDSSWVGHTTPGAQTDGLARAFLRFGPNARDVQFRIPMLANANASAEVFETEAGARKIHAIAYTNSQSGDWRHGWTSLAESYAAHQIIDPYFDAGKQVMTTG